jgi:hybrid cluster-associated redox disulfide protein
MVKNKATKITEDMTLAEIYKYPKAKEILGKFQLPCLSCPMAQYELTDLKLGAVAHKYGLDIDAVLKELNESIK